MLSPFNNIFVVDFEFVVNPGDHAQPVCLVFHEINSAETKWIWLEGKNPLTITPPYPMGETDLFVAYYSSAEWGCHLSLNWPLPAPDLYPEFRLLTNGLPGVSKGLLGVCQRFGVNAISESEKKTTRTRIMQGPPYTGKEKEEIINYCESDVLETAELFKRMLPYIDVPRALFRGRYMETFATMEHNGIPVNIETLEKLKAKWVPIQEKLISDTTGIIEFMRVQLFKLRDSKNTCDQTILHDQELKKASRN
jgi:DNA polymerase I